MTVHLFSIFDSVFDVIFYDIAMREYSTLSVRKSFISIFLISTPI